MNRLNVRNRRRIGCKHLVRVLLLSFVLTLNSTLMTASPGMAQDGCACRSAISFGEFEWYSPGSDTACSRYGPSKFYYEVCDDGRPPNGWIYVRDEFNDYWFVFSLSVEGGEAKIVNGTYTAIDRCGNEISVEGEAAWALAQIVDSSIPDVIGMWTCGAAFDGGSPGKDNDWVFIAGPVSFDDAKGLYDEAISGNQIYPFWAPVVKGNVLIK